MDAIKSYYEEEIKKYIESDKEPPEPYDVYIYILCKIKIFLYY